jgi:hypothetical protein
LVEQLLKSLADTYWIAFSYAHPFGEKREVRYAGCEAISVKVAEKSQKRAYGD